MTVDSRIPKVMGYVEALVDRKSQLLIEDEQLKERQSMHGAYDYADGAFV
ncbi:hypothetical protein [Aeromonas caviae]|uniref:Uncharacterized protein n=1 Tax=Aeromonas caviae TaxID=648 RepID=A0AAJ5ZBJ5_AERCA|nr:hypothetical protein [Aeromonas caviae]WFG00301.1 hypothetical protein P5S46_21300 [Aeromonas caviae]